MSGVAVKIDGTKFGEITINGKPYDSDMTVFWNGKLMYRTKEHKIEVGELLPILRPGPEIIVVGTGQEGTIQITPEVSAIAEQKGVTIYAEKTEKAVELFNAFSDQGKKVVGIFHVTC